MCSYCGCRSITIIGQFSNEHDDIIDHLTALRTACAAGDLAAVEAAARQMEHVLHPHTHTEEVTLFAEMRKDEEFTEHIDGLCAEHTDLDAVLDLIKAGAHDRFHEFENALRVHIDREENGLFPASAIALDGEQWDRIHEAAGL